VVAVADMVAEAVVVAVGGIIRAGINH